METTFRATASGLLVPAPLSRKRIVLAKDDAKALRRALRIFGTLEVMTAFKCKSRKCKEPSVQRILDSAGNTVLRCGCTDRVLESRF